jgi:predicted PhzF superfamily epimerase YddE/YHI9
MSKKFLDYFGELLITRVRDKAILEWDMIVDGKMKDASSKEIKKNLMKFNAEQIDLVRRLIPQIVDTTLHHLLWTLEQEKSIDVAVKTDSEVVPSIREISDGLAGELYTEDGWIMRFSKQRYEEP